MGTSLVVQWLRICIANAKDTGSIPGQGTRIPHAMGQLSSSATATEPTRHNQTEALTMKQRGCVLS